MLIRNQFILKIIAFSLLILPYIYLFGYYSHGYGIRHDYELTFIFDEISVVVTLLGLLLFEFSRKGRDFFLFTHLLLVPIVINASFPYGSKNPDGALFAVHLISYLIMCISIYIYKFRTKEQRAIP